MQYIKNRPIIENFHVLHKHFSAVGIEPTTSDADGNIGFGLNFCKLYVINIIRYTFLSFHGN